MRQGSQKWENDDSRYERDESEVPLEPPDGDEYVGLELRRDV